MAAAAPQTIRAQRLTPEAYAPYGDVIAADEARPFKPANFGTAKRFNFLAKVQNLRPDSAELNLCVFRCSAVTGAEMLIKVLEKHPESTQVFMPMHDGRFVTIVALGGDKPDLTTLAAFIVEGPQGISYRPGIWHYPMTALGSQLDLACLVWEDGGKADCTLVDLPDPITVKL